ncbi:unnamed protein product [Didymodactylos carnosus]|uniref:EF-hand domain-containing protein n=1 Tax=Didymodactylos carnosus TaxID=1234261 RepID=A0A814YDL2_9BILA|nr:unnamed protein product [Didymodactylos carnosus]CAF1240028.1 unnamed protein product [Didymodactylos carnosus]CAF3990647.1 unnamed protein product [Didymodactylos carnosus]CAF4047332.1 unnamed protein product [Didymodactylos carnosus]
MHLQQSEQSVHVKQCEHSVSLAKDSIAKVPTINVTHKGNEKEKRISTHLSMHDLTNANAAAPETCKELLQGIIIADWSSEPDLINLSSSKKLKSSAIPQVASSQNLPKMQSISNENDDDTIRRNKILTLFYKTDTNNDGYINEDEFCNLMKQLDPHNQSLNHKFDEITKTDEGRLTFDEFYYFLLSNIKEKSPTDSCLNESDRTDRMVLFRNKLEQQISNKLNNDEDFSIRIQSILESVDVNEMTKHLADRWMNFNDFERLGQKGSSVMTGGESAEDILPGEYDLLQLACCSIEPKCAKIKNVRWLSCDQPNVSGICAFPPEFDGKIPVDIATNEHLSYYACCLASSAVDMKVSLSYRHCFQNFIYNENYKQDYVKKDGHGGLEKHAFTHLDCPLEDDSGYFILGKFVGENKNELHLTAFYIPTKHTLYVPPLTIHSNDYLKGAWRTMLSDETSIDHVSLSHQHRSDGHDTYEHFTFEFVQ